MDWNARCLNSIREDKKRIEASYGIQINQTDIACQYCGGSWSFFHTCSKMPSERKEEIEEIKRSWERPISSKTIPQWREELGVKFGMPKETALEKFRQWREPRKTCQRCEGENYVESCPIRLICKEADNVRDDSERDDNGSGVIEAPEPETLRVGLPSDRQRVALRSDVSEKKGISRRGSYGLVQTTPDTASDTRRNPARTLNKPPSCSQINVDTPDNGELEKGNGQICQNCSGTFCPIISQRVSWCHKKEKNFGETGF